MIKFYIKVFTVTLLAIAGLTLRSNAQTEYYRAIKVDMDFSYGSHSTGAIAIEPHYRLTDLAAVGVRGEVAAINTNDVSNGTAGYYSLCLTAEQYLASQKSYGDFRFFVSAGAGSFTYSTSLTQKSTFGYFPRIGFEANHFRMAVDYNITGSGFNYLQIGIGFFVGGGKK